jgi:hypothetical protein
MLHQGSCQNKPSVSSSLKCATFHRYTFTIHLLFTKNMSEQGTLSYTIPRVLIEENYTTFSTNVLVARAQSNSAALQ